MKCNDSTVSHKYPPTAADYAFCSYGDVTIRQDDSKKGEGSFSEKFYPWQWTSIRKFGGACNKEFGL
jgi:hypothetical protein